MNIEEFETIMDDENEEIETNFEDGNIFRGLEIIRKYIHEADIVAAERDIVYCCEVEKLVDAGITEEDAKHLKALNWMVEEDSLACFF